MFFSSITFFVSGAMMPAGYSPALNGSITSVPYLLEEQLMHARIGGQFRVKRGHHVPSLLHQDGIAFVTRQYC
jgi:hypothetical protein